MKKKLSALALSALAAAGIAVAAPAPQAQAAEQTITAYTTGYTWYDNTPAGSATIAAPVIHSVAGGVGTYANPITLAVGSRNGSWTFSPGTRFYIPSLHRYFIAEDTGGSQLTYPPSGASAWLDLWIGGSSVSSYTATQCANRITNNHKVIVNPGSGYVVASGSGVLHNGYCDAGYSETPVRTATSYSAPTTTTTTSSTRYYYVQSGDTLSTIARKFGYSSWTTIYYANKATISNPDVLNVGQRLILP